MGLRRSFQITCDDCGDEGPEGGHSSYVQDEARRCDWSYSSRHGWRCPECNGRNDRLYGDD